MSAIVMMRKRMAAEFLGGDCKPIRMVSEEIWTIEKNLKGTGKDGRPCLDDSSTIALGTFIGIQQPLLRMN
jgi:hypothetical protein